MIKIRRVKVEDAEEINSLRRETFEKINGKDYTREQINELNKTNTLNKLIEKMKKRDMFCIVEDGHILGVIDLEDNKIGGLFVKYNLIGKGIGTKLLEFIENYAKNKGIKKIHLFSTKFAVKFYSKKGYNSIESKPTNNEFTSMEMEKELR